MVKTMTIYTLFIQALEKIANGENPINEMRELVCHKDYVELGDRVRTVCNMNAPLTALMNQYTNELLDWDIKCEGYFEI